LDSGHAFGVRQAIAVPLSAPLNAGKEEGPFHPESSSCQLTCIVPELSCHKIYVFMMYEILEFRGTANAPMEVAERIGKDNVPAL
jgi:hypothetical protein